MTDGIEMARSLDESLSKILSTETLLDSVRDDLPLERATVSTIDDLGLSAIAVAEEQDGLGLPLEDRVRIAAVMGRRLVPAALRDEAFGAAPALANSPDGVLLVEELITGGARAAVALTQSDGEAVAIVPPSLDFLVILEEQRTKVFRGDDPGLKVEPLHGLDAGQGLSLVDVEGAESITEYEGEIARQVRREYEVCLVSEALGSAEYTLEISAEYADDRKQFGRPISTFQAVSHLLGEMKLAIETSRAGISRYVDLDREQEASVDELDRWRATLVYSVPEAARRVCEIAIQVHGGIGFSWELGLHLHYRRILANQFLLGGESATAERIGINYLERRQGK